MSDILSLLQDQQDELLDDELDAIEEELATGSYSALYLRRASELLSLIRRNRNEKYEHHEDPETPKQGAQSSLVMGLGEFAGNHESNGLDPVEIFFQDIINMRDTEGYKSAFKNYIKDNPVLTEELIEKRFAFFRSWEIEAITKVKPLSEPFLEKYFGTLDHEAIARHQQFSESFFMKHFAQLDAEIVLKNKHNAWRTKENRSKQLDVFLRLKGVKL